MTDRLGLVADIGGTNARFALVAPGGRAEAAEIWRTADFDSLEAALTRFLDQEAKRRGAPRIALRGAAICAAGPVVEGAVNMTNAPWIVSVEGIRAATGVPEPILVNDFTALAHCIPALQAGERRRVGGGWPEPGHPIAILGPGTGLGVSGLIPDPHGDYIALSSEGGHVDLPAASEREMAVLFYLAEEIGHVSAERVLSGPGLQSVYGALAALDDKPDAPLPAPSEIARRAAQGDDSVAAETVRMFCAWLGAVAGNLALTLGARGGVYLAGGILPRWGDLFDAGLFRRRFEEKGRFDAYLRPIPTYLVTAEEPAFIGLARLLGRSMTAEA